jgi:ubiquinone/menaquinone biosynthesis C-methylase UbiE
MISTNHQVARAYDAIAPVYDAQLAQNPVARYMRARLQEHFARIFHPGDYVLDLAAGTGADACFLAARGISVVALDVSPGMIAELERAAAQRGLHVETHVQPAEHLAQLELCDLDGAISTFGGLNTVQQLPRLAQDLATCLKPRGRVILHALNDFCFWQTAALLAHAKIQIARKSEVHVGQAVMTHRFNNPFALWRDAFARYFVLREVYALSVVAAPSLVKRFPRASRALITLDRIAGRVFPAAGDFFVMELEKGDG